MDKFKESVEKNEEILQKIQKIEKNLTSTKPKQIPHPVLYVSKKEFITKQFFTVFPFIILAVVILWQNYELKTYVKQRCDYFVETQEAIQENLNERKHFEFVSDFGIFQRQMAKDITQINLNINTWLETEELEHDFLNDKIEEIKDQIQLILERFRILNETGSSEEKNKLKVRLEKLEKNSLKSKATQIVKEIDKKKE